MTLPPPGPGQQPHPLWPQYQYPQYGPPSQWGGPPPPNPKNNRGAWVALGLLLVAGAVGLTLFLVLGGDDDDAGGSADDTPSSQQAPASDSPEAVADRWMHAALVGDLDTALALSCADAKSQGDGVTEAEFAALYEPMDHYEIGDIKQKGADRAVVTIEVTTTEDGQATTEEMDMVLVKESGEYRYCGFGAVSAPTHERPPRPARA